MGLEYKISLGEAATAGVGAAAGAALGGVWGAFGGGALGSMIYDAFAGDSHHYSPHYKVRKDYYK